MAKDYSVQTIRDLEDLFDQQKILRPIRLRRYEQGAELFYDIKGVIPAKLGRVKLIVEEFIGGGYAGQVYRVKVLDIKSSEGGVEGIQVGETYAMKILVPPSGFARMFRNMVYALAFQGPFSLQVNPSAARAGAIWQKFLQRGTKIRLDSERAVVDIHATFIDSALGSCGEQDSAGKWETLKTISAHPNTGPRKPSWSDSSNSCLRWGRWNLPASTNGPHVKANPTPSNDWRAIPPPMKDMWL
jgi:hypothetical protein